MYFAESSCILTIIIFCSQRAGFFSHHENKTLLINGEAHSVTTDWSNIDLYNCNIDSNKSLTITSTKVNDPFTWISFIELHSASK